MAKFKRVPLNRNTATPEQVSELERVATAIVLDLFEDEAEIEAAAAAFTARDIADDGVDPGQARSGVWKRLAQTEMEKERASRTPPGRSDRGSRSYVESVTKLIESLVKSPLGSPVALSSGGAREDTERDDRRIVPLSELFDPSCLETRLPWAGSTLRLIRRHRPAASTPQMLMAKIDPREPGLRQRGVLHVVLTAPDGHQAQVRLTPRKPGGTFEGGPLPEDWDKISIKAYIEGDDEYDSETSRS